MNFLVKVKTYTWCSKVEVVLLTTKHNVKMHNEYSEKLKKKQLTLAIFAK
jgi:hypothetical protein